MKTLKIVSILLFLFTIPNIYCYEELDNTFSIENLVCDLNSLEEIATQFLLFTKTNPLVPIILNKSNLNLLREKEKNVFIISGYLTISLLTGPPQLRDAYLQRYDANVIIFDWSLLSFEFYPILTCKMPKVAEFVANFLCEVNKLDFPLSAFHIVGVSLGAHLSGLIGQKTIELCNEQIGRITGLDPAGPLFQHAPKDKRLDPSDALFVDVIHTNELSAGYYGNCGHVDFHVNCGRIQPGCPQLDRVNILGGCSHLKSLLYMIESVNSNNFIAQSCSWCPEECGGDADPEYIVMGENCPNNSTKKVFWIPTHSIPPFSAACSLYECGCT